MRVWSSLDTKRHAKFRPKIKFYAVLNWKKIQFSESARFAWIWELIPTSTYISFLRQTVSALQFCGLFYQILIFSGATILVFPEEDNRQFSKRRIKYKKRRLVRLQNHPKLQIFTTVDSSKYLQCQLFFPVFKFY